MNDSPWPRGLITPLVTPLASDVLDEGALEPLVERQIAAGVCGVVVGGGTGEFGALTLDERRAVAERVAAIADKRLAVIVQAGTLATRDALTLASHAEQVGATGVLLASPFGEPISWAERKHFYEAVNDATPLPIMVYNTPSAGLLSLRQLQELAELSHVTAVKDSSGDVTLLGDVLQWSADREFAVYVGLDSLLAFGASNGARGVMIGTGNVIPAEIVTVFRRCQDEPGSDEVSDLWARMREFLRFMEDSSNYVALCKVAVGLRGIDVGEVRGPYLTPDDSERAALAAQLKSMCQAFTSQVQAEAVS